MNIPAARTYRCARRLLPVGVLVLMTSTAFSATTLYRWTGGSATSGNWSTGANWLGGVAPTGGDQRLIFDPGAARKVNTNNLAAGTTFESIWVSDEGYNIHGNPVRIDYLRARCNSGTSTTFRPDILASGDLQIINETNNTTFNVLGDIVLTADNLTFPGTSLGDVVIGGVISGTGDVFKLNASGDVSFSGLGANTYVGNTFVSAGVLRLNRYNLAGGLTFTGATAIPGDLTIGDFASTLVGDIVVLDRENQIANTSTVFVHPTGSLELSDENETVGELRLRGGTVTTGSGLLAVDGGIYASLPLNVSKDSLIAGRLSLGSRGDGAQIVDVAFGAQLNITAQISGVTTTDLIKTNGGSLFLTESNTFAGDVEIKDGSVTITDGSALGTTNGVTRLMGGRLHLNPPSSFGVPEHLEVVGLDVSENVIWLPSGNNAALLGNLRLDRNLLFDIATNATLTVVGKISGPSGWLKYGPGTLQFKTPYTNDYEGQSQVNNGAFIMDGVLNQPVVPGGLFIAPVVNGTARAWMIKNNQIADTATVTIFENGSLELIGFNDTIGQLRLLDGGKVETGTGTLTINGNISSQRQLSAVEPSSIHGQLSLGGSQRTIHAYDSPHTVNLLITAVISDGGAAAGFNKEGAGSVQLTGANTFNGPVSVTDGTLIVSDSSALGTTAGGTTVSGTNGAKIVLQAGGGNIVTLEPLTLNSTGPGSPVALENFSGVNQWNGPITLLAPENTISVISIPRPLALGGAVGGPGGLRKVGPGHLTLNGLPANTFSGLTTLADGDLILDKPTSEAINASTLVVGDNVGLPNTDRVIVRGLGDEINNGTRVVINGSGQLILDGFLDLVGSIEGAGNIHFANATSGLIVGRNDLSTTFDGVISGAGGFEKVGAGTLVLNGNHTYTGQSGATEGTLVVNGSIASSLHVQLNRPLIVVTNTPFGIIAGTGFVPAIFPYPGGTVSPGTSPGRLTVQGNADLANSDLRIELNGTLPGVSYDQLRVTGNVNLNNTKLFFFTGFPPTTNDTFLILEKTTPGPINGFFLNTTEGSVMGTGFHKYRITYQGGDGNDVVLRRVEIPASNITGIAAATDEKMQITGQGVPFVTYILEATPTLNAPIPWTPIATNTANALGIYEFIDAYAEGGTTLLPARFYRVLTP